MLFTSWLSAVTDHASSSSAMLALHDRFRRLTLGFKPPCRRSAERMPIAVEFLEARSLLTVMAANDSFMTLHDHPVTVAVPGVLINDTATGSYNPVTMTYTPPGPLSANLVSNPTHGSLSFNSNGSFTYTPNAGFVGADTFTYKAAAGTQTTTAATVSISVSNAAPSAVNDAYTTRHDQTLTVPTNAGVMMNDSDVNGDPITPTLLTSTSNGTLALNSTTGSFNYAPNAGFVGNDSFSYKVSDGIQDSSAATVSITVWNTDAFANSATLTELRPKTLFFCAVFVPND